LSHRVNVEIRVNIIFIHFNFKSVDVRS